METPPAVQLPAVRLRVPTHEDAFVWHRLFDDPEVMEFHGGAPAELSMYEELTARQRRHDAELGFCFWTVLDEAGEPIGFTGAQPWSRPWGPAGEIEIGWRLARSAWGKGYATAAARATVERLRAAGVPSVVAMVAAGNERSVAVTRRLGMELGETFTTPSAPGDDGGDDNGGRRVAYCFRLVL
ncbi:GNAT family N-acetyltransferase [Streptomyces sp. BG9H]|uniref:GNAT family N-acetyltransferase n=1 Tax=Streptomyces anatolicus TaxID=2675858 RepID=A0ABS6YJ80_9ACTN|nr:GNAT family N-acetyltransferase [Streptomyces anatolicus]